MSYDTLANHYETIFTLMQEHHWAWTDVQHMIPFERDVYLIFLRQWVEKKNQEILNAKQRAGAS